MLARVLRTEELCAVLGLGLGLANDDGLKREALAVRLVAERSVEEVEVTVLRVLRERKVAEGKFHLASS
jgi:hypothetical protein